MKKILLYLIVFAGFMACNKDGEFFSDEESLITQQSDYALQAEELLNQLTSKQLDLLTPEDISEFKKGPELETEMRNQGNQYGSWHPVLALFNCQVNENTTMGEGHWFGYGHSSLKIDEAPNPDSGFEDGNFILTNPEQAKLMGTYRSNRLHRFGYQRLKGKFETGTQIFFNPHGNLRMLAFFNQNGSDSVQILALGWVKYGLADPPVPLEFEEYFTFDALYEHYAGLKEITGAEPMYVKTFNEFWIYPTTDQDNLAAPGVGQGEWLDNGPVTFVVDQTITSNFVEGAGRWRLYNGQGENYQSMQYMEFCHTQTIGATGGTWPFELVGGSEAYFNQGGKGTGVWIGLGDPNAVFGNIPDPGLLPFDMIDDGFTCEPYGSTDCAGYCVPGGDGVNTLVYIIAYKYPLQNNNCMSVADDGTIQYSLDAATVVLPDGQTFTGGGVLPGEITMGSYTGMISSAGYKQFMTPFGQVTLGVTLFDDGDGNMFWASNMVIGYPISQTEFQLIQKHTIVGGTGDFADARGVLRINGVLDGTTGIINYNMVGEMCL